MPFCTECGARHDDKAKVCPSCGSAIFQPPSDDELDDVLASLDDDLQMAASPSVDELAPDLEDDGLDAPFGEATPDYVEQIQEIRGAIAAQSTALQELTDLSWENPAAAQVRDELTVALAQLRELTPPGDLAPAHGDFVQGAEHLVHGFVALVDSISEPGADDKVDAAQEEIAQATERFRLGAEALNTYITSSPDDAEDDDVDGPVADDFPAVDDLDLDLDAEPAALADEPTLPELDAAETQEEEPELELDLPEDLFAPAMAATEEDELEPTASTPDDDIPPLPPELADLDDLPEPFADLSSGALRGLGAVAPAVPDPEPEPRYQASAASDAFGAWPTLGDPATDSLLLEIEGGWVRGRQGVYDSIERAIRAAVADALRGALATRGRVEEEARATLQRIAGERNRLLDEVDALRREATQLQAEAAEVRRTLTDLERERQVAQDRRQHMFQEAEAHRSQLLSEIEQLGGQLEAMRRNIVSLLNMSAAVADGADAAPTERPPTAGV